MLIENIIEFKNDKLFIFGCIKMLTINNIDFIDNEYIYEILTIDKNFLLSEYKWNDLVYLCNLIILQEYINNVKFENLYIPQFFMRHFNYLSDKYPSIFDKNVKNKLGEFMYDIRICNPKIYYEINSKVDYNIDKLFDIIDEIANFEINKYLIQDVYSVLFSILLKLDEIKKYFLFKLIALLKNIISILAMVDLTLSLNSYKSNIALIKLNKLILEKIMSEFFSLFKIDRQLNIPQPINDNESSIINLFLNSEFKHIFDIIKNEITFKIIKISINQPKNNFSYECPKIIGKIIPFFLPIQIKIKNISDFSLDSNIYIIKNLVVDLRYKSNHITIPIYYNDIKYNEQVKKLIINKKTPINPHPEYKATVRLKNMYMRELTSLLYQNFPQIENIQSNSICSDKIIFNIIK